ncbi:MAG: spore cortex biosynthesis protein YabQ [Clostridia bacterium]|nr:spore cortex biosynthesis protein YabQ [Clostridia bacterium]
MMISNDQQFLLLWRCLGCGVWLDLCWIILNCIRHRYIRTKAMRFLFDCVFVVLSGLCLFVFSLAVSGGELRGAMLLAITVGGYVSHLSFGHMLSRLLSGFFRVVKTVDAVSKGCLRKTAEIWQKKRKKVEFFCKKHLQSAHLRVYNRNNK